MSESKSAVEKKEGLENRVAWGISCLATCSCSANFCYQKPRRTRHYPGAGKSTADVSHSAATADSSSAGSRNTATFQPIPIVLALHKAWRLPNAVRLTSLARPISASVALEIVRRALLPCRCQPLTGLARSFTRRLWRPPDLLSSTSLLCAKPHDAHLFIRLLSFS